MVVPTCSLTPALSPSGGGSQIPGILGAKHFSSVWLRLGRGGFRSVVREFERELAVLSMVGADRDPPVAILDNAIRDAQAQPHAFAHVLGGEERVKDLVDDLR